MLGKEKMIPDGNLDLPKEERAQKIVTTCINRYFYYLNFIKK